MGLSIRAREYLHREMQERFARERAAQAAVDLLRDQFELEGMPTRLACQTLNISRRTLIRWIERGVITPLPGGTVGVSHRFALADVLALRDRRMGKAKATD